MQELLMLSTVQSTFSHMSLSFCLSGNVSSSLHHSDQRSHVSKCLCHSLCLSLSLSKIQKIQSWIFDSVIYTLQSCLRVSDTVTVCGQIKMTKWQMSRVEYNMVYMLKNDGRQ